MKAVIKTQARNEGRHVHLNLSKNTYQGQSDAAIWSAFQKQCPEAFLFIYQTHFTALFNYGNQFLGDKEAVKDLIQDLFIELREKAGKLSGVNHIKFYLFKCLKRKILRLKKKSHLPNYPNFATEVPAFAVGLSQEQQMVSDETKRDLSRALDAAYDTLSERQREILLYYYYEGLSYEEITELMGFSKQEHARKLVHRSICKLREHMGKLKAVLAMGSLFAIIALF